MPATQHNFSIDQGTSFSLVITSKDTDKNIIDITGYCARLIMTTDNGQVYTFSTGNVNISEYKFVVEGSLGKLSLFIPAATTNNFSFNTAKYDLELQSPNEHYAGGGKYTERLLFGNIVLNKRYSKSSTLLDCAT